MDTSDAVDFIRFGICEMASLALRHRQIRSISAMSGGEEFRPSSPDVAACMAGCIRSAERLPISADNALYKTDCWRPDDRSGRTPTRAPMAPRSPSSPRRRRFTAVDDPASQPTARRSRASNDLDARGVGIL